MAVTPCTGAPWWINPAFCSDPKPPSFAAPFDTAHTRLCQSIIIRRSAAGFGRGPGGIAVFVVRFANMDLIARQSACCGFTVMLKPSPVPCIAADASMQLEFLGDLASANTPREVAAVVVRLAQAEPSCKGATMIWGLSATQHPQSEPASQFGGEELVLARAATVHLLPTFSTDGRGLALRLSETIPANPSAVLLLSIDARSDGQRFVDATSTQLDIAGRHLSRAVESEGLQISFNRLERSERLQRALFAISELASSDRDMQHMLREIHAIVGTLMYAENFFIVLHDAERDSLKFLYHSDTQDSAPRDPNREISMKSREHSLTWCLLRDGLPLMGSAEQLRTQVSGPLTIIGPDSLDRLGVPMLRNGHRLGVPLLISDGVIGLVVVQSYDASTLYGAADTELLNFVGSQVTRTLQRRYAAESLQEAHAQLKQRVDERTRELHARNAELEVANAKLKGAQEQAIQSEKLASIGQLAAGVAHEINNPIGYVNSNLSTLQGYTTQLLNAIDAYAVELGRAGNEASMAQAEQIRRRFDIDFLSQDLRQLLAESREGIDRVCKIVHDLKDFSRSDRSSAWVRADINTGLESTLSIVSNQLKYKAQIVKSFAELPLIECLPAELNQVFLNILMNAGQAIAERGIITVSTGVSGDKVWIAIGDDGEGIPAEVLPRIFDPFFTTKPVGSGTGLGLAISYGIVTKHHGTIEITSDPGEGTLMRIELPIEQPK
jgi:signal transduction histidine kinase